MALVKRRIEADGLHLVVQTHGRGPEVVFAHGLTAHRGVTWRQLRPLARSHRAVGFDQRGHGDSTPVRDARLFALERMAADIGRIQDSLGLNSCVVGGESMGAATALSFALNNPARVKALLLTAPALGDRPHRDAQLVRIIAEQIESLGLKGFLRASAEQMRREQIIPETGIRYITRFRGVHDPASLALACRTVIDWVVLEDLQALRSLPFPACILCWPDDPLHPLELAERLAAALPRAQLIKLSSPAEFFVDPPTVGRHYLEFLSGLGL
jgi:pimeloyl-ACP methyl ester carboxylesterase